MMSGKRTSANTAAVILFLALGGQALASSSDTAGGDEAMADVLRRLTALEAQNHELTLQVEELRQHNQVLQAGSALVASTAPAAAPENAAATPAAAAEWASRIRVAGDFRFRHENIDVEDLPTDRTRETMRARIAAAIRFTDDIEGEIGIASGGLEPRGASATLGAASSRKEIGLDLAYARWRPVEALAMTAGKMRQPFVRPGTSLFIDNEIRPEGIAINYEAGGVFGSAFAFWLEERAQAADSMLLGAQLGWTGAFDRLNLKLSAGYYDYGSIQGRFPGFANSLVSEFGNSIEGSGADARYVYDYDVGQLFAEANLMAGDLPLSLFADYARNFAADDGFDTAYTVGVTVGKASSPGRWQAGVATQAVEKDALFGHWLDSDFAGGLTDNQGQLYRVSWMPVKNLLMNLTYMDTVFNVDIGEESDYDRWQVEFNLGF
jgi:hypothetical protein